MRLAVRAVAMAALLVVGATPARGGAAKWHRPEADRRVPLRVVNRTGRTAAGYPFWTSLDSLNTVGRVNWRAVRLFSEDGKERPCQADDLDANKRFDPGDALAALLDVPKGETTYYLYLPSDAKAPTSRIRTRVVARADAKRRTVYVNNGLVRVSMSSRPGHENRQVIERKLGGRWLPLAGEWSVSPMFDGKWGGWETVSSQVRAASVGPARGVLRHTLRLRAKASGKTLSIIHDYSVFAGRGEVASELAVVNTSTDQMLTLSRLVPGFYAVTPGGAYDFERDRYAGLDPKGKVLTGALKTTGFRVRRTRYRKAMWCDAQAGEGRPPLGLGLVVERPLDSIYALCVADVFRRGKHKLRMSVYYIFRDTTLWPGKAYSVLHWYCAHTGGPEPVAGFRELRNGVRITPGDVEFRDGD